MQEKLSVRLDPDLAKWLRRRAAERHITVSALLQECVRRARDDDRLELLTRACLHGVCLLLAGDGAGPEDVRRAKAELVNTGRREIERAAGQSGRHTRPGEGETDSAEPPPPRRPVPGRP